MTALPSNDENLLKEEYFHLQKIIEDFDSKAITIKTWSVSGSLVVIGAGLSEKGSKELFLVASIASLLFWFIEANWKGFQLSFYSRINRIEAYFADREHKQIKPLQISSSWQKSWTGQYKKGILSIMLWPTVMLPHALLLVGGIVLYYLTYSGVIVLPGKG